jgi:hypothetical protein
VSEDWQDNWNEYNRRRRALIVAYLMLPLWGAIGSMFSALVRRVGLADVANYAFAWPVLLPLCAAKFRVLRWRCPRCRKPYHFKSRYLYADFWARQCLHCGLQKWQKSEKDQLV